MTFNAYLDLIFDSAITYNRVMEGTLTLSPDHIIKSKEEEAKVKQILMLIRNLPSNLGGRENKKLIKLAKMYSRGSTQKEFSELLGCSIVHVKRVSNLLCGKIDGKLPDKFDVMFRNRQFDDIIRYLSANTSSNLAEALEPRLGILYDHPNWGAVRARMTISSTMFSDIKPDENLLAGLFRLLDELNQTVDKIMSDEDALDQLAYLTRATKEGLYLPPKAIKWLLPESSDTIYGEVLDDFENIK